MGTLSIVQIMETDGVRMKNKVITYHVLLPEGEESFMLTAVTEDAEP